MGVGCGAGFCFKSDGLLADEHLQLPGYLDRVFRDAGGAGCGARNRNKAEQVVVAGKRVRGSRRGREVHFVGGADHAGAVLPSEHAIVPDKFALRSLRFLLRGATAGQKYVVERRPILSVPDAVSESWKCESIHFEFDIGEFEYAGNESFDNRPNPVSILDHAEGGRVWRIRPLAWPADYYAGSSDSVCKAEKSAVARGHYD